MAASWQFWPSLCLAFRSCDKMTSASLRAWIDPPLARESARFGGKRIVLHASSGEGYRCLVPSRDAHSVDIPSKSSSNLHHLPGPDGVRARTGDVLFFLASLATRSNMIANASTLANRCSGRLASARETTVAIVFGMPRRAACSGGGSARQCPAATSTNEPENGRFPLSHS